MSQKLREELDSWLGTKFHLYGRRKKTAMDKGACDCIGLIFGLAENLKIISPRKKTDLNKYDHFNYQLNDNQKKIENFLDEHFYFEKKLSFYQIVLFQIDEYLQHVGISTIYASKEIGLVHADLRSRQIIEHHLNYYWQKKIKKIYKFNN